jgi:hypothetical protein
MEGGRVFNMAGYFIAGGEGNLRWVNISTFVLDWEGKNYRQELFGQ